MNEVYTMLEEPSQDLEICETTSDDTHMAAELKTRSNSEKNCAIWNMKATNTLLKLYENKLEMIETPKKKTRIWLAISESLKDYNIEMTPDQIRWKINALTKKYKQCLSKGQPEKFRYFQAMDNIYSQYNVDSDSHTITQLLEKRKDPRRIGVFEPHTKFSHETKAMIEMRKIRLAKRLESDRTQSKILLEKQWLEYLRRQEEQKQWRDEICERNLKLREEELELRKRELELKESLEYKKIQLMEKDLDDMLQIEKEKCGLLKEIFNKKL